MTRSRSAHRGHRVQVHVVTVPGHGQLHRQHLAGSPGTERGQGGSAAPPVEWCVSPTPDELALPGLNGLHVPALDVGAAPALLSATQPDRERLATEHGVNQ